MADENQRMVPHVFVTRGDLTKLSCDAWLLPTDQGFQVTETWLNRLPELKPQVESLRRGANVPENWHAGRSRVLSLEAPSSTPRPYLVNEGAHSGIEVEWFVAGVHEFLETVADDLRSSAPLNSRVTHLVALPLVGTGRGGGAEHAGDIMRALLPELERAADTHKFDIALVTANGPAFAAAQSVRRSSVGQDRETPAGWADLDEALLNHARRLTEQAAAGSLVLFLGAGVSAGAGLPNWNDLLKELAQRAGMAAELEALKKLDILDAGAVVVTRLKKHGESAASVIGQLFDKGCYSLAHSLLAALPVTEVVTTNYDTLFELASAGAGYPAQVLPYAPAVKKERWLLKLHGSVQYPDDIVLSREDYLRYADRRAALAGIVQALLITRHMLFVGFSLSDQNFHRIADDVRKAVRGPNGGDQVDQEFGTALFLERDRLREELWRGDLHCVSMSERDTAGAKDARRAEIFLDYLLADASGHVAPLLDDAYVSILSGEERQIRNLLLSLEGAVTPELEQTPAWRRVANLLREFRGG
ncbi:MAG TPA: SIR2 family protein [Chloroflexota bacterium]|nr:SIR2 family protein [Chloroflexota bacterium]